MVRFYPNALPCMHMQIHSYSSGLPVVIFVTFYCKMIERLKYCINTAGSLSIVIEKDFPLVKMQNKKKLKDPIIKRSC